MGLRAGAEALASAKKVVPAAEAEAETEAEAEAAPATRAEAEAESEGRAEAETGAEAERLKGLRGMEIGKWWKQHFHWLCTNNDGANQVCFAALRHHGITEADLARGYFCDPST